MLVQGTSRARDCYNIIIIIGSDVSYNTHERHLHGPPTPPASRSRHDRRRYFIIIVIMRVRFIII